MRFAGTWIRYSNSAMPHDTSAATIQGFARRSRRCAYQAKVMNTFEQTSRSAVRPIFRIRLGYPPARGRATVSAQELAVGAERLAERREGLAVAPAVREVARTVRAQA